MEFEYLLRGFENALQEPMNFTYSVDMQKLFNQPTREMVETVDMNAIWLLEKADKILGLIRAFEVEIDRGISVSPEQRKRFDKLVEDARQKSRELRAQWRIINKQVNHLKHQIERAEIEYDNHILIRR